MNSFPASLSTDTVPATQAPSRRRVFPLSAISRRTALWSPLLGIALVAPSTMVASFFPITATDGKQFAEVAAAPVAAVLAHILCGPALEELIFRGVVVQCGRRLMPLWAAVALSAALFGAFHFTLGPSRVAIAAVAGVVLCWLALSRRSLYASFLCHAAFNGTCCIIGSLFHLGDKVSAARSSGQTLGMFDILPAWWSIGSIALAIAAFVMLMRESRPAAAPAKT